MGLQVDRGGATGGGIGSPAQPHDLTHTPVALWQFDGNLNDTSGNGLNLSVQTSVSGTERYTYLLPGLQGVNLDDSTILTRGVNDAALEILGDITVEWIGFWNGQTNTRDASAALFACQGPGETAAENWLYSARWNLTGDTPRMESFWEQGSGSNVLYTANDSWPTQNVFHGAYRRESNVVSFFLNGQLINQSGVLTGPTSGTNSIFRVGGNDANLEVWQGCLASLKVVDSALTDAQIKAEYNLTLGPVFGTLP